MRRRHLLLAAILLVIPVAAVAKTALNADVWNGSEIYWREPRAGIIESAETGRPVLMVFHATWCGVCRHYREVFKNKEVVERSRDFVMILVDADKNPDVNTAFSPDGIYVPRTMFISPKGKISKTLVGPDPQYPYTVDASAPDELLSLMRRAREDYKITAPTSPTASTNRS